MTRIFLAIALLFLSVSVIQAAEQAKPPLKGDCVPTKSEMPSAKNPIAATAQEVTTAEFRLVNATTVWLRLYIDGEGAGSAAPGDQTVSTVSVGTHTAQVVAPDGRTLTHTGTVPLGGLTWTVSEENE